MARKTPKPTNPFVFGPLALDDAFTDREAELKELAADMLNGQDVVVYAPRRYGKSSLVLRAAQQAVAKGARVGYCDLLRVTSKERLAAALAKTIHRDIDGRAGAQRAAELFRGLRVTPTIEVDSHGTFSFSFRATRRKADIDDTIEGLLELLDHVGRERGKRVVIVFDEFQEIVELDPGSPNLLRSVFQAQPDVSHVYLGSRRHILDRIFNDEHQPFWRSAKKLEIGVISPAKFARFLRKRFDDTDKGITDEALNRLLETTGGHPYATQEVAYEVWEATPSGRFAREPEVEAAIEKVLRSEHNHLEKLWEDAPATQRQVLVALATEPAASPYSADYRAAYDLPAPSTLQIALGALEQKELVARGEDGTLAIVEPFFADWIRREQQSAPLPLRRRR